MPFLSRVLAYFGILAACGYALAAGIPVLLVAGTAALPEHVTTPQPPRITAWVERRAAVMPELPQPHGPALTADELRAYARPARAEPTVRIPIVAMTEESDPPPARVSSARRDQPKPRRATPQPVNETYRTADAEEPSYAPTARERYAPERND